MNFEQNWSDLKSICIWFAIIFGALSLILSVVLLIKQRDRFLPFLKGWFFTFVVLAFSVGICAFILTCRQMAAEGELIPQLFYPIGITIVWAIVGIILLPIQYHVAPEKVRMSGLVWSVGLAVCLVVAIAFIGRYYVNVIATSGYYENVSTVALVIGSVILAAVLIAVAVFCGQKTDKSEHTRSVVFAGVSVALSFALSYITFFKMPQGGSITLASMLPILVYSYRYGARKGILAGIVYGLLQAIQDPWIIHPAQFLLDYPLAFAMLGTSGWLRSLKIKKLNGFATFAIGGVTAIVMRYIAHVISGIFAFSSYAAEGYGAVAWGFLYNTFCLVDGAISMVLGALLYANRGVRRLVFGDLAATNASAEAATDQEASFAPTESVDAPAVATYAPSAQQEVATPSSPAETPAPVAYAPGETETQSPDGDADAQ